MDVTARVRRSGDWWAIEVPEVPGVFSQSKRLDQVVAMVTDAVALMASVAVSEVNVNVELWLDEKLRESLDRVAEASAAAAAEQENASRLARETVARLRDEHYSVRDVGAMMNLSPQRVSQIASKA